MCGRYRLSRRKQVVEEYFDTVSDEPNWNPRYNIAPTQPIPNHPAEPEGTPGIIFDALGFDPVMGKRPVSCRPDD